MDLTHKIIPLFNKKQINEIYFALACDRHMIDIYNLKKFKRGRVLYVIICILLPFKVNS